MWYKWLHINSTNANTYSLISQNDVYDELQIFVINVAISNHSRWGKIASHFYKKKKKKNFSIRNWAPISNSRIFHPVTEIKWIATTEKRKYFFRKLGNHPQQSTRKKRRERERGEKRKYQTNYKKLLEKTLTLTFLPAPFIPSPLFVPRRQEIRKIKSFFFALIQNYYTKRKKQKTK